MEIKTTANSFNKQGINIPVCSCLKCGHISICAIYKAIKPLMGNWEEQQQPFKAEEISKVCLLYAPNFIVVPEMAKEKTLN